MARKPDEWMPLHIGAYHADTTHLTRDQHGAYILLLMAYWRRGGPLPADDGRLAAIAKATPAEWRKIRPAMVEFFTEQDGAWHQKRADEELSKAKRMTEAKAEAGRKGAASKWHSHGKTDGTAMAEPSDSHRQTDAPIPQPKPTPDQKNISSFVVGRGKRGGGGVTIEDPNERIARFQKTIAQALGKNGWTIVAAAADPTSPDYEQALQACKSAAQRIGKGWPRLWPAPQHSHAAGRA
jgi:uncharacterized protein YdaU (DUF1376 family)